MGEATNDWLEERVQKTRGRPLVYDHMCQVFLLPEYAPETRRTIVWGRDWRLDPELPISLRYKNGAHGLRNCDETTYAVKERGRKLLERLTLTRGFLNDKVAMEVRYYATHESFQQTVQLLLRHEEHFNLAFQVFHVIEELWLHETERFGGVPTELPVYIEGRINRPGLLDELSNVYKLKALHVYEGRLLPPRPEYYG